MQEIRELATQFQQFLNNDFRHASADISALKAQMRLVLAGLSVLLIMMATILAGLAMEILK